MRMSVCELMTLLKQYEAASPGKDVLVQVQYDEWEGKEDGSYKTRTGTVGVRDFRWGPQGAVVVAEVLS